MVTLPGGEPEPKLFRPPAPKPQKGPLGPFAMLATLRRNPIETWTEAHFEHFLLSGRTILGNTAVVSAPSAIRRILVENADNYRKDGLQRRILAPGLGDDSPPDGVGAKAADGKMLRAYGNFGCGTLIFSEFTNEPEHAGAIGGQSGADGQFKIQSQSSKVKKMVYAGYLLFRAGKIVILRERAVTGGALRYCSLITAAIATPGAGLQDTTSWPMATRHSVICWAGPK